MIPFLLQNRGAGGILNGADFILPLGDLGAGAVDTSGRLAGTTLSFTRATVAWTKLSTGLWAQVASGTARSVYTGATTAAGNYAGFFSELAGTQLVTPTASIRDMTNAAWTATSITAAKTGTGIDGVSNSCSRLTCDLDGGKITQTLTAAASSRTYSAWIRRVTGTGTISITQDDGATSTDVTSSIVSTHFVRVELNASQLNAVFGIIMGTATDVILVDFNQFEAGAVATSPMASAGAARNADVLVYTSAANYGTTGSAYFEGTPLRVDASTKGGMAINDNSANEQVFLYAASGTPTSSTFQVNDGGASQGAVTLGSAWSLNTMTKMAGFWVASNFNQATNGTLGTADTSSTMPTTNQILIGSLGAGGSQWGGGIKNVRVWSRRLSSSELVGITV